MKLGDKLGPYEITALLGKGGMGEVYRARDTRLQREVAVKVCAEQFSDRFMREARAVAALNHPNVCAIYDVGPNYLVMELVEGETLAERIRQGAIPVDEALAIARQIADGLEAAHEKGITHRDLKPGNVKIEPDGKVKVLDFGLAKIAEPGPQPRSDSEISPTITVGAMTGIGTILGTAGYMAPEQAKGKTVDKRADIWAFGVVLYEMVTGSRLFQGEDLTETLASVVKDQPDLSVAPRKVQRLLSRCLEKDPKKRLRDISVVWELLEEPPPPAQLRPNARLPWAIAGVCLLLAAAVTFLWYRTRSPAQGERVYFDIAPPPGTRFAGVPAFSPDGQSIAFVTASPNSVNSLYVRRLAALAARALPGTEGAAYAFWSPDGRSLGFTTRSGLKRIDLAGGAPQSLYGLNVGSTNGTWNQFGDILFTAGENVIMRVSETGGPLTPVTRLDEKQGEISHRFPQFLPDGKRFLFFVYGAGSLSGGGDAQEVLGIRGDESRNTVELAQLGSLERKTVLRGVSAAIFARGRGGEAFLLLPSQQHAGGAAVQRISRRGIWRAGEHRI